MHKLISSRVIFGDNNNYDGKVIERAKEKCLICTQRIFILEEIGIDLSQDGKNYGICFHTLVSLVNI